MERGVIISTFNVSCNETRCESAYPVSVEDWSGDAFWPNFVNTRGKIGVALNQSGNNLSLVLEGEVSAGLPGSPSINGRLDIEFGQDGPAIKRSGNEFPAYEAYQTIGGATETIMQSRARTHGYLIDGLPGAAFRLFSTKDYWP